jgi:hypothetical protein
MLTYAALRCCVWTEGRRGCVGGVVRGVGEGSRSGEGGEARYGGEFEGFSLVGGSGVGGQGEVQRVPIGWGGEYDRRCLLSQMSDVC